MVKPKHTDTYKPNKIAGGHPQMIGYARVSKSEQENGLGAQLHELKKAGCSVIYSEMVSGGTSPQPILAQCLEQLRKGDTLCVVRIDRLSRRMSKTVLLLEQLGAQGIFFCSTAQSLNTRQANQKVIIHMIAALAESERDLIRERTKDGLAEAARRGRRGGHPVRLTLPVLEMIAHLKSKGHSNRQIAKAVKLSETSVRVAITRLGDKTESRQMKLAGLSP